MYAPTGGSGFEKCPDGAYVAKCLGFFFIGRHTNRFQPEEPPRDRGMFVFELDKRDEKGRRHATIARETWTAHKKGNIRTKCAPAMVPESFTWTDDDWGRQDLEALFKGKDLLINLVNGYPRGYLALPRDKQPIEQERGLEGEWDDYGGLHPVVNKERYGESATRQGTYADAAARFAEPFATKPGKVKTKPDPAAVALAKEVGGDPVATPTDDIPWSEDEPQF